MNFANAMKNTMDDRKTLTTNGAVVYATSGHELLDLNFAVGSLRNKPESEIKDRFARAYFENPMYAMRWLFYLGDIRGGLGERRTFNTCIDWLLENKPDVLKAVLILIPDYSRWDYLLRLIDSPVKGEVKMIAENQFKKDLKSMSEGSNVSLIAKWAYSQNCSNNEKRRLGRILAKELGLNPKKYRKMLSSLRRYMNVVEVDMSAKNWSEINYEAVPSKANLIYNAAFLRNDEERRREYLASLEKGTAKINSSVLFPHDIVHKYMDGSWHRALGKEDPAVEAMWKGLPDYVQGNGNTIVVGDGSGSMYSRIDNNSNVMAVDVANALAIYFAEHMNGQFKNQYITFGSDPHLVNFSNCKSLRDKLALACKNTDCGSTDIEEVFNLILNTAVDNNMNQEDMPQNVLIISDMQFDSYACCTFGRLYSESLASNSTLFDKIAAKYARYGYQLPKLIFWNVNSPNGGVPVKQNPAGVILVSGFSPAVCKMVLSNKTDPYEALIETISSHAYDAVEQAVKDVI